MFAASIGAVQLFRLSSDNNTREERFSQEGRLGGYAQDADPSLITDGELEKWDAGAIYITGEAQTDFDTYENTTYVGFMDERAKNLQKLLLKKGGYPKAPTEAAVVETTAKALGLGEIGETFTLNITEDGKTAKRNLSWPASCGNTRSIPGGSCRRCSQASRATGIHTLKLILYMELI